MGGRIELSHDDRPHPSAPPVQRLRVRYAKRGRLRFSSHRDLARVFERALRRVHVPMAYSQGFTPHPKISWAPSVPTGVASISEYVELQLVEAVVPEALCRELDAALPGGFDVLEVVEAGPGALADRLGTSRWRIELPGVDPAELHEAVDRLLAADRVEVRRMTKQGMRTFDARAALVSAEVEIATAPEPAVIALGDDVPDATAQVDDWPKRPPAYGILVTVVRQTTPVVRPDDVLSALRVVAGLAPPVAACATRWEQGRLDDEGGLTDPLAQDRVAAGARRDE
jgi:radical SAM-linked protein